MDGERFLAPVFKLRQRHRLPRLHRTAWDFSFGNKTGESRRDGLEKGGQGRRGAQEEAPTVPAAPAMVQGSRQPAEMPETI